MRRDCVLLLLRSPSLVLVKTKTQPTAMSAVNMANAEQALVVPQFGSHLTEQVNR